MSQADVEAIWAEHRQRAMDVAYRISGRLADAEDAVQEAYARLLATDVSEIDDPRGWLTTVTARICLDHVRRHEQSRRAYVGPWLPEPVVTSDAISVEDRITLDDSVQLALLVVLQQLSPAERTSFLLHDVFGLPFEQVGEVVGRSAQACRQLASRARRRIADDPLASPRTVDLDEHRLVVERFRAACEAGDVDALASVLAHDVVGDFDSGGVIPGAPLEELSGAATVATQLIGSVGHLDAQWLAVDVNGTPGVMARLGRRTIAVLWLGVRAGRVDAILAVGNPDKLRHLA